MEIQPSLVLINSSNEFQARLNAKQTSRLEIAEIPEYNEITNSECALKHRSICKHNVASQFKLYYMFYDVSRMVGGISFFN